MAVNLHAKRHTNEKLGQIDHLGAAEVPEVKDGHAEVVLLQRQSKESRQRNNQKIHFSWLLDSLDPTFLCTKKVLGYAQASEVYIEKKKISLLPPQSQQKYLTTNPFQQIETLRFQNLFNFL